MKQIFVSQDCGLLNKHRVEDYVDSTTSGYQSAGPTDAIFNPNTSATSATSAHYYSCNDSTLLLHEYSVPSLDADHFLNLFTYTKKRLRV